MTSEVEWHRARLVLGWGTAWEHLRVLSAFAFPLLTIPVEVCSAYSCALVVSSVLAGLLFLVFGLMCLSDLFLRCDLACWGWVGAGAGVPCCLYVRGGACFVLCLLWQVCLLVLGCACACCFPCLFFSVLCKMVFVMCAGVSFSSCCFGGCASVLLCPLCLCACWLGRFFLLSVNSCPLWCDLGCRGWVGAGAAVPCCLCVVVLALPCVSWGKAAFLSWVVLVFAAPPVYFFRCCVSCLL